MTSSKSWTCAVTAMLVAPVNILAAQATPADSGFAVQRLTDGVYAVVRNEPQGVINESNSLFIIGDTGVIVVDAQSSSARTRETLAALRRLTSAPVRTLINTHWHDDHAIGNHVWAEAYPGLQIVAHASAPEDMTTIAAQFRKSSVESRRGTIDFLRGLVSRRQSYLGGPIGEAEARSHTLSAWLLEDYANATATFTPLAPTRTVADRLTLTLGARTVEVQHLGRGHTRGDLVVYLPAERLLAAGDLVMWPVPFVGSTSYPAEFAHTLDRLQTLGATTVVPGHGRVLRGDDARAHIRLVARMLHAIADGVGAAVSRGDSLARVRRSVTLDEFRREIAGTDPMRNVLFGYYVTGSAIPRAYEQARDAAARTGTPEARATSTLWIDPAWGDTTRRGENARVVLWFDRQLLNGGDEYARATQRFATARRRALRQAIVDSLKRLAEGSWTRARPALTQLEQDGVVSRCERHWVVNSVTCDIRPRDVNRLAAVPGAFRAYRLGPRSNSTHPIPPAAVGCSPRTDNYRPDPARAPWNAQLLGVDRVWREFGLTGRGVLHVVHDFGWTLSPPNILPTLWCNPGEIPGNGIDDDNNGYVDDVHGFNLEQRNAGIIGGSVITAGVTHGDVTAAMLAGRDLVDSAYVSGIAPGSRWAAVEANGNIEGGIEWALAVGADTYSMSFSIPNLGELRGHWRRVAEHAALAGLFLVSGAGNFATPGAANFEPVPVQMRVPEDIPLAVFGVSGVARNGQRPPFSSQGPVHWSTVDYRDGEVPKPDFAATNMNLVAPDSLGRWAFRGPNGWAGNSFAGPQTAGVIALMLEANPDLTPWAVRAILVETARDVPPAGVDFQTGAGVIDGYRAVVRARAGIAR